MTPESSAIEPIQPRSGLLRTSVLLFLFFASGAAALIYEVLWLKELGRLFGVTSYATSTTLAVFFLGLAVGGWFWGRRSAETRNPLRTYGLLEFAIALSAGLYFFTLGLYRTLYGPLFTVVGDRPALFLAVKFVLAVGILFPPAFFMGGTLPVMGQFMIRQKGQLGLKASLLYGVNTVGAATGALLAGFLLPVTLGFRNSYLVAMGLNVIIGVVVLVWSRSVEPTVDEPGTTDPPDPELETLDRVDLGPRMIWTMAIFSGFATLGLEVLWVRMYAQVLQNSVYTFAAILTVFLLALSLGSVLANFLCRRTWAPVSVLFALLLLSGLFVGLTPLAFYRLTSGLEQLGGSSGWTRYIVEVFGITFAVLLIPGAVIGSVFPYLMKLSERWSDSAGKTIGQLAAVNTTGAIVGSLAAGFVMLDAIGLWMSIRVMALVYLGLALLVPLGTSRARSYVKVLPLAGICLFAAVLTYSNFASVHIDSDSGEEVLQIWEGSHGTVAVVRQGEALRMKLNNSYTLGGSASAVLHRRHSWLPLSIHPAPRSVFYLGMGTGISAGASLDHPVETVLVSELSPDVIEASRLHFGPVLNGLFEDPRVAVVEEDGRNLLFGLDEQYDVIIADLFLSWKAGVGDLYTREHFESVRSRLAPGGLFAQWLPLAQMTEREVGIIVRTMLEVFPQVTAWRRGFSLETPALALIGQDPVSALDDEAFVRNLERLVEAGRIDRSDWTMRVPHAAYVGNLTLSREIFSAASINTDDRPLIEYMAPISHRDAVARNSVSLTGTGLVSFYRELLGACPPADDPYLSMLNKAELNAVWAGFELQSYLVAQRVGKTREAEVHLGRFQQLSGISSFRTR